MDSAIMHTMQSSDDSMVLAVPDPPPPAMRNLRILYQLAATSAPALTSIRLRNHHGPGLRTRQSRPRHDYAARRFATPKNCAEGRRERAKNTSVPTTRRRPHPRAGPRRFMASRTIINHVLKTAKACSRATP